MIRVYLGLEPDSLIETPPEYIIMAALPSVGQNILTSSGMIYTVKKIAWFSMLDARYYPRLILV